MTAFEAELVGTFVLILLGCGVVANVTLNQTKGFQGGLIAITTAWALAVFVGVTIAGPYSGAHLNPAVTLSMMIVGEISLEDSLNYVLAQFLGAMLGALVVWIFYKNHLEATDDAATTQGVFCTLLRFVIISTIF